jgi:hypothetical protein
VQKAALESSLQNQRLDGVAGGLRPREAAKQRVPSGGLSDGEPSDGSGDGRSRSRKAAEKKAKGEAKAAAKAAAGAVPSAAPA